MCRNIPRAWSRKIGTARGFVFVTPQYNWGYPAPLKNALDHLGREWEGKPAVIVTYGGHGGSKCAAQLRQVVEGREMLPTATMPALKLASSVIEGAPHDPQTDFTAAEAELLRRSIRELAVALGERAAPN